MTGPVVADTGVRRSVLALSPVGAYGGFNTSVHRVSALTELGFDVAVVDSGSLPGSGAAALATRLRAWLFRRGLPIHGRDPGRDAARLLDAARGGEWCLVWLEKALSLGAGALHALREACPGALIVGFSPDDMAALHNQSREFLEALPFYDHFLTTKSHNAGELLAMGCPAVTVVQNGYDPAAFRPMPVSPEDIARLGGEVGFIGTYEDARFEMMSALALAGIPVRVWGSGWESVVAPCPGLVLEKRPLHGDDFAKAVGAFKVNLGFLRKANRDQQTTRSVEIPACGGFMLAERTQEHLALFREGIEADFFASTAELVERCRYYLSHAAIRLDVARAGRERCQASGYSNTHRLGAALRGLIPGLPTAAASFGESSRVR